MNSPKLQLKQNYKSDWHEIKTVFNNLDFYYDVLPGNRARMLTNGIFESIDAPGPRTQFKEILGVGFSYKF